MAPAYLKSAEGISGQWSEAIDELFRSWDRDGSPGAIIAVQLGDEVIHQRGYGVANIEDDIPFTPDTVLRLGSTSKHFCATCMLILENRGLLSLGDDVRKHVPDMPDFGHVVTLRHLLTMTSGLWDGINLPLFAGLNTGYAFTRAQLLRLGLKQKSLMFPPGDDCTYSNTNYHLLSVIIERMADMSIAEFMQAEIFRPLGMDRTELVPWMKKVTRHKARGYNCSHSSGDGNDGCWEAGYMAMETCGDGGIDSTIGDMLKWLNNYRNDRHFGPRFRRRLEAENCLNDGRQLKYRLGIERSDYRGSVKVHHAGGMPGYLCDFAWFPEQDLGIVLFTNLMDGTMLSLPDRVADIVIGDELTEAETSTFVPATRADKENLIGVYGNVEAGHVIELNQFDGKLVCYFHGELNLLLERDGALVSAKSLIELQPEPGTGSLRLILGCQPPVVLKPMDDPRLTPAPLPAGAEHFVGIYHDPVTEARHQVTLEDGVLRVSIAAPMLDLVWDVLTPVGGDLFTAMVKGEPSCTNVIARFLRDESGRVKQLDYSLNRCRNVVFDRIEPGIRI